MTWSNYLETNHNINSKAFKMLVLIYNKKTLDNYYIKYHFNLQCYQTETFFSQFFSLFGHVGVEKFKKSLI